MYHQINDIINLLRYSYNSITILISRALNITILISRPHPRILTKIVTIICTNYCLKNYIKYTIKVSKDP